MYKTLLVRSGLRLTQTRLITSSTYTANHLSSISNTRTMANTTYNSRPLAAAILEDHNELREYHEVS